MQIPRYFSKKLIRPILKISWPFFVFWMTASIMVYTDIIILGWLKTPVDLGLYSAAQRLIQFLLVIPNLVALATLPLFSKLITESKEKLRATLEKTLSLVILFGAPVVLGGILLGKEIILKVFGHAYVNSTLVFQIFLVMLLLMFPIIIINNYIFTYNIQRKFVRYTIAGAILNIILNLALIPQFGIYGAALGTVVSSLTLALVTWYIAKRFNYFEIWSRIKKILLASLIMGLATFTAKHLGFGLFLNIGLSALIFVGTLYALKESLLQDIRIILRNKYIS